MPAPLRVVCGRPRTFLALLIGIVAFFVLPSSAARFSFFFLSLSLSLFLLVTRLLVIGWDVFIAFYLHAGLTA